MCLLATEDAKFGGRVNIFEEGNHIFGPLDKQEK